MKVPRLLIAVMVTVNMTAALAQPPDLMPRVQTSPSIAPGPPANSGAATAAAAAAAKPHQSGSPSKAVSKAAPKAAAEDIAASKAADSLQLGTTEISGNRELPKLLYVVPWRRDELGNFVGRPPNSLVDEALAPVDREVFQRQNHYYAALQSSATSAKSQPGSTSAPAKQAHPQDER